MLHAPEVANVVDACSVEGRQERLDTLLAGLELCEKALQVRCLQRYHWRTLFSCMSRAAFHPSWPMYSCTAFFRSKAHYSCSCLRPSQSMKLMHTWRLSLTGRLRLTHAVAQDYLETKRVAFPRFYFVAPADLLDILAKGSNPQAILRCVLACPQPGHAHCCWLLSQNSGVKPVAARCGCTAAASIIAEQRSGAESGVRGAGTCQRTLTTCTTWSSRRTPRGTPPRLPSACTLVSS